MKYYLIIIFTLLNFFVGISQTENQRLISIQNQLTALSIENPGLTEEVKTEINVTQVTLSNFLMGLAELHQININVNTELDNIIIAQNFNNVNVSDVLIFLCKNYNLTIEFTGSILSIKPYNSPLPTPEKRTIPIFYNPLDNTISIDSKNDSLYELFKKIMDESGKNLVFSPELENKEIIFYTSLAPFEYAMDKMAFANNLYYEKTKDGFYLFESIEHDVTQGAVNKQRRKNNSFVYKILNLEEQELEIEANKIPIKDIIEELSLAFNLDTYLASPLDLAGSTTIHTKSIFLDDLFTKIFENKTSPNTPITNTNSSRDSNNQPLSTVNLMYTYKKEGNMYFFGTIDQISARKVEIIHLKHRSVELLSDPSGGMQIKTSNLSDSQNYNNSGFNNTYSNQFDNISNNNNNNNNNNNRSREPISTNSNTDFNTYTNKAEALVNILPDEIKRDLDIKIDYELNSFYVNGPGVNVDRFRSFINQIDKPVPVVLIEVMFIEVNQNATIEAGVSWGIGEESTTTRGSIYPSTNLSLGAETINKILTGFSGFSTFNLGSVVPNFFATIKAMETNGNLKIKSTPKLSTLNGHKASFSNGQTSYYTVTQRNIYGTDNPQTSEITNYYPIEAELGLTIKPVVSGNGQVTLDIYVIQSSFGTRISEDAPPDINSRNFSSIIRVQDQDIVVLGGIEENIKDNTGTGVPLLSKIPVLKWLFSSRKKEVNNSKLTVLIKPTVIY